MSEPETKPGDGGGGEAKAAAGTEEVKVPSNPEVAKEEPSKQPKKDKWKSFQKFMYNKEAGEVMGRSGLSWFKIFIFYVVFYTALFAFFFLMLFTALATMPAKEPKYTGEESLLGKTPGLSYVPVFKNDKGQNAKGFEFFGKTVPNTVKKMGEQLKAYLESIEKNNDDLKDCASSDTDKDKDKAKPCKVDTKGDWGECKAPHYGWEGGVEVKDFKPCLLIKVNRVWGWTPGKKKEEAKKEEPKKEEAKKGRAGEETPKNEDKKEEEKFKDVKIKCKHTTDKGNATVTHYPRDGVIPGHYFPFVGQKNFASPFVMIQLSGITTTKKEHIMEITCKVNKENELKFQFLLHKKPD